MQVSRYIVNGPKVIRWCSACWVRFTSQHETPCDSEITIKKTLITKEK